YNPAQRWYYFPEMTADEVILFKGYDSESHYQPRAAHSAFDNRRKHPDATPRASIEGRFFVYFACDSGGSSRAPSVSRTAPLDLRRDISLEALQPAVRLRAHVPPVRHVGELLEFLRRELKIGDACGRLGLGARGDVADVLIEELTVFLA